MIFCLKIYLTFPNSVDPDEMSQYALCGISSWSSLFVKSTCLGVSSIQRVHTKYMWLNLYLIPDKHFSTEQTTLALNGGKGANSLPSYRHLFNTFAKRADPDQAALVRAA